MFKNEQITSSLSYIIDYDHKYSKAEDFLNIYINVLQDKSIRKEKFPKKRFYFVYEHNGIKEYLLTSNVVYLGNPHKIFKKRIELKPWYKDFYELHKNEPNSIIRFIGIYSYDSMSVFVDFKIDTYTENAFNNSGAHVYTNDIYQALKNGYFERVDKNKNQIRVIRHDKFYDFLNNSETIKHNKIFDLFEKFNCGFPFGKWITAVKAITEMKDKNFSKWKEGEWAGWFLELYFWEFTDQVKCKELMKYSKDFTDLEKEFDFDIYFKELDFYGDLKSHSKLRSEIPLNDQKAMTKCIMKYGRMWYVIYNHDTKKDRNFDNEMAIERLKLIGEPYSGEGEISYADRMKHSVNFENMEILELNTINSTELLEAFNQGHQYKSKDNRAPKFKINSRNIDNFIVYSYEGNK